MEFLLILIGIALVLFVPVSCIAMWVRTGNLKDEVEWLRREVAALKTAPPSGSAATPAASAFYSAKPGPVPPSAPSPVPSPAVTPPPRPISSVPLSSGTVEIWEDEAQPARPQKGARETYQAGGPARRSGFEFNFGQKLPVWIGGIALALSGFYLVKYTIEKDLITDQLRVLLGLLFGAALILAARFIRVHRAGMADAVRITQALSGSGVAVLYASVYAAATLYELVSPAAGFVGLALVTLLACLLALRHGMPIAVLGMLGGFVTPAMISTDHPNLGALLVYLYCLLTGLFSLIRRQDWWVLGLPTLVLAFLWVLFWIFGSGHFGPADGFLLGLFIVAVTVTVVGQTPRVPEKDARQPAGWSDALNYIVCGGAVLLMGIVTARSGFRIENWALYGLLGLGSFILAGFRPAQYRIAPWAALAVTLVMLGAWDAPDDARFFIVLLAFAALFGLGSYVLLRRRHALDHAGQLAATALGFYGIGYLRLKEDLYPLLGLQPGETLHLWGLIAILLAALFAALTARLLGIAADEKLRQRLLAVSALTATAFISIALTIEVREKFLAAAFAFQLLAVCWINTKVDIRALRGIAAALFAIFVALMAQQILMLVALVLHSLFGHSPRFWGSNLPLATDPLFQLGVPMVMTGLSAWYLQRQRDGRLAEFLEMGTVGLGALLLYYGTRNLLHVPEDVLFHKPGFVERGLLTNLFYAAGLAVAYAGRFYSRRAVLWSGMALFFMALFRTFWFDFVTANPLFTGQPVGGALLVNGLALAFLLPAFWLWLEGRPQLRLVTIWPALRGLMMLALIFAYVSLSVRHAFHGPVLDEGATPNAEVYTYSLVWLLLGAALLLFGTARQDKPMRSASLVVMLLTIGKVFLYDAGELDGLYRVFSFLGLGLSLIGLSWFYSRFVFKANAPE